MIASRRDEDDIELPPGVRVEDGHIGDLRQDPHNPRRHTPRNIGMIERSLSENGAGRSLTASADGYIISGNGTVEAAANAGIEEAIFVHTSGDRLVVHVRDDLAYGDPTAGRLGMYDNRSAELASWDADVLAAMHDDDIVAQLFTEDEIRRLLNSPAPEMGGSGGGEGLGDDEERPALGGVVYRVVVQFASEDEQMAFIEEMDQRQIPAKAIIV